MVPKKILTNEEQRAKLNEADRIAKAARISPEIATRLGAFVIYSGMVDFSAIQSARLVERIVPKYQHSIGLTPPAAHQDTYFYDSKISTGKIFRIIRKWLRKHLTDISSDSETIKMLGQKMIDLGFRYLQDRNVIVHHLGNPEREFNHFITLCDRALTTYDKYIKANADFIATAGRYA